MRSLLERRRVTGDSVGTFDAIAVALDGREANAQVFQVRDGVLSDRQSFYLSNETERDPARSPRSSCSSTTAGRSRSRRCSSSRARLGERPALADALASRREGPVELRAAERGEKRRILELAERNARLALDQEKLRSERRRQGRVEALEGLQLALGLDAPPMRIECFDISNLGGTHTVASMVVFEGGAPKKSDYRRFKIRSTEGAPDDFASMAEVLERRFAQWERQADISPHDPSYDPSFASLPNLVVIDGGKGQLSAGLGPLAGFRERGVAVISLAKRIEEVFQPGRSTPLVLDHSTPELQLLQRVRDEAHRFAITHHRSRRDSAMTSSVLDGLPGVGESRKRALLNHFGSPDAVLAASQEELQSVPGVPAKVGRDVHAYLHRAG